MAGPDYLLRVFLTIVLIPFTYSITNGIGAGLIAFVAVKACRGRWREAGWLVTVIALLFVVYFAVDGIKAVV